MTPQEKLIQQHQLLLADMVAWLRERGIEIAVGWEMEDFLAPLSHDNLDGYLVERVTNTEGKVQQLYRDIDLCGWHYMVQQCAFSCVVERACKDKSVLMMFAEKGFKETALALCDNRGFIRDMNAVLQIHKKRKSDSTISEQIRHAIEQAVLGPYVEDVDEYIGLMVKKDKKNIRHYGNFLENMVTRFFETEEAFRGDTIAYTRLIHGLQKGGYLSEADAYDMLVLFSPGHWKSVAEASEAARLEMRALLLRRIVSPDFQAKMPHLPLPPYDFIDLPQLLGDLESAGVLPFPVAVYQEREALGERAGVVEELLSNHADTAARSAAIPNLINVFFDATYVATKLTDHIDTLKKEFWSAEVKRFIDYRKQQGIVDLDSQQLLDSLERMRYITFSLLEIASLGVSDYTRIPQTNNLIEHFGLFLLTLPEFQYLTEIIPFDIIGRVNSREPEAKLSTLEPDREESLRRALSDYGTVVKEELHHKLRHTFSPLSLAMAADGMISDARSNETSHLLLHFLESRLREKGVNVNHVYRERSGGPHRYEITTWPFSTIDGEAVGVDPLMAAEWHQTITQTTEEVLQALGFFHSRGITTANGRSSQINGSVTFQGQQIPRELLIRLADTKVEMNDVDGFLMFSEQKPASYVRNGPGVASAHRALRTLEEDGHPKDEALACVRGAEGSPSERIEERTGDLLGNPYISLVGYVATMVRGLERTNPEDPDFYVDYDGPVVLTEQYRPSARVCEEIRRLGGEIAELSIPLPRAALPVAELVEITELFDEEDLYPKTGGNVITRVCGSWNDPSYWTKIADARPDEGVFAAPLLRGSLAETQADFALSRNPHVRRILGPLRPYILQHIGEQTELNGFSEFR